MSRYLQKFLKQWNKTNYSESEQEESDRYSCPPWNDRVLNWVEWINEQKQTN